MKLEIKGQTIMLLATLLLLAGCKQKSGLEILNNRMAGLNALQSEYIIHEEGEKDVKVSVLFAKPNNILITSDNFVVALNEQDGHFESLFSDKVYDRLPWTGQIYPGTGKLVSRNMVNAGPAAANPPSNIVPATPWKLESKSGNIERYTKTVQSMDGPQTFKLEITTDGVPVKYISSEDITYEVKSFQLVDNIAPEKFRVEPKDGFVCHRIETDTMTLQSDAKFDWSPFKAASDVSNFKLDEATMFVLVDPQEATSVNALNWIKTQGKGFRKVTISRGNATSGFYDPNGTQLDKLTSNTPTFVLVDRQSKIIGLWMGFDREKVTEFDKEIESVLTKKD